MLRDKILEILDKVHHGQAPETYIDELEALFNSNLKEQREGKWYCPSCNLAPKSHLCCEHNCKPIESI